MKKGFLALGILLSLCGGILTLLPACCCDRSCPAKCEPADCDQCDDLGDVDYVDEK